MDKSEATGNQAQTVSNAGYERPSRDSVINDIVQLMKHMPVGRLNGVAFLLRSPAGSRIFSPRTAHGMSLFNRLQGIDDIFAKCEHRVMRHATSMDAYQQKMALEQRMFELNTVLVDVGATMAMEFNIDKTSFDEAIDERIKAMKQERKRAAQAEKGAKRSRPAKENTASILDNTSTATIGDEAIAVEVV